AALRSGAPDEEIARVWRLAMWVPGAPEVCGRPARSPPPPTVDGGAGLHRHLLGARRPGLG
ncbi:hypothetical protein, partial [Streptomyces sp. NPDC003857]